jgi:hypothetical protein
MGYSFFLFAFGFWFVVLSVKSNREERGFAVVERNNEQARLLVSGFMLTGFDLDLIGALLQLWLFSIANFSAFFALCSCYCMFEVKEV